jgi:hypothetical protein
MAEQTPCVVPKKMFWHSKRFWSMVIAIGGGIPTTTSAVVAGIALIPVNPVLGVAALVGAFASLVGTAGMAYWGLTSPGTVTLRQSDATPKAEK